MFALGGVIAYFADRLGRNLGKKRLSLFGLRPRHTAELLTVAAGALIPVITIVIVMVVSRDVREWLLNGPAIVQQQRDAVKRLDDAQKDLIHTQEQLKG